VNLEMLEIEPVALDDRLGSGDAAVAREV